MQGSSVASVLQNKAMQSMSEDKPHISPKRNGNVFLSPRLVAFDIEARLLGPGVAAETITQVRKAVQFI